MCYQSYPFAPVEGGYSQTSAQGVSVNVVETRQVWVTLPGDHSSHKLTAAQARDLLRKLEEVV